MKKFELLNQETNSVIEHTYVLQDENGKIFYKEWESEGKIIDSAMRDKDGFEIDDPELVEQVQEFIDNLGPGMFIDGDEWEREMGR
jgi:hypothetical protein